MIAKLKEFATKVAAWYRLEVETRRYALFVESQWGWVVVVIVFAVVLNACT